MRAKPKPFSRTFKRTRAQIPVLLSVGREAQKSLHPASILDLSFLGMRVRAEAELKLGQVVSVTRMTGASAGVPGQVVWVGPRGSEAEGQAGLRYTNPLHARIASR
jgi:PilZ domain-containing protein